VKGARKARRRVRRALKGQPRSQRRAPGWQKAPRPWRECCRAWGSGRGRLAGLGLCARQLAGRTGGSFRRWRQRGAGDMHAGLLPYSILVAELP
jgi:hypothetical protein